MLIYRTALPPALQPLAGNGRHGVAIRTPGPATCKSRFLTGETRPPIARRKAQPMAATLRDIMLAADVQPKVIDDGLALVDEQISDKSGISGTAVKLAYKSVVSFSPGHVRYMIEQLMPAMLEKLEPYWAEFAASGGGVFGDYLAKRGDEVSESLLEITDARAAASWRAAIVKAYKAVRGSAAKNVQTALPDLGALVQKYAG
jgi:hypothetical protein